MAAEMTIFPTPTEKIKFIPAVILSISKNISAPFRSSLSIQNETAVGHEAPTMRKMY
jgi:hypothetical protein